MITCASVNLVILQSTLMDWMVAAKGSTCEERMLGMTFDRQLRICISRLGEMGKERFWRRLISEILGQRNRQITQKKDGWIKTHWVCKRSKGLVYTWTRWKITQMERMLESIKKSHRKCQLSLKYLTLAPFLSSDSFANCFRTSTFWFRRNGFSGFYLHIVCVCVG